MATIEKKVIAALVSVNYSDFLELVLPFNTKIFDTIYVITTKEDKKCIDICSKYNNVNSAWPNIYDLNNPNNTKVDFNFVEKNRTKIYFSSSDNLKIVHKNLCAYNLAPCTPTKNYLNQFNIYKNKRGYLTLKLNK